MGPRTPQQKQRADRLREMREQLFPEIRQSQLWDWRHAKGWVWVPRALTTMLVIIDDLAGKNNRVSPAYLELLCQANEEFVATLGNKQQMAFNCGCRGQRGVRTWLKKIQRLEKLGFIRTKAGPDGPQSFAIIFDPYQVIEKIIVEKKLPEEMATAFYARINAVGADDLSTAKKKKRAEMDAVDGLVENKGAKPKTPTPK